MRPVLPGTDVPRVRVELPAGRERLRRGHGRLHLRRRGGGKHGNAHDDEGRRREQGGAGAAQHERHMMAQGEP